MSHCDQRQMWAGFLQQTGSAASCLWPRGTRALAKSVRLERSCTTPLGANNIGKGRKWLT
jgi:hypothetical protein